MADYIVGYAPTCTVDGNDVYFSAGKWDRGVMARVARVDDWLTNADLTSSQQITAVGGEQEDGTFKLTVGDATGWTNSHRISPSRQEQPFLYSTPATAEAAMSAGDTMLMWYADEDETPTHVYMVNNGSSTTKNINLFGMTRSIGIKTGANTAFYPSGASGGCEMYCLRIWGYTSVVVVGDLGNNDFVIDRCEFVGSGTDQVWSRFAGHKIIARNSIFTGCTTPFKWEVGAYAGQHEVYNCNFYGTRYGFFGSNSIDIIGRNLLAFDTGTADFIFVTSFGDYDYCVSRDATATGANSHASKNPGTYGFFGYRYGLSLYNLDSGAWLSGKGVAVSGVAEDFYGRTRPNPPAIGACEVGDVVDFPSSSNVINDDYVDQSAGVFASPTAATVKTGTQYGADGTEYTGTYSGGSEPARPTITSATASDGTVTLALTLSSESNTAHVEYRASDGTTWDGTAETFSRTGSGNVAVGGLTNDKAYQFVSYETEGGLHSLASNTAYAIPTDGTNSAAGPLALPVSNLRTLLSASTTFQGLVGASSSSEALASIYVQEIDEDDALSARPFALVMLGDGYTAPSIAMGDHMQYRETGTLIMYFEADTPSSVADSNQDAAYWFMGKVGNIIDEMKALAGKDAYLMVQEMRLADGPWRAHRKSWKTDGDHFFAAFEVDWGPDE